MNKPKKDAPAPATQKVNFGTATNNSGKAQPKVAKASPQRPKK